MRICGVKKNKHGSNFQNIASKTIQRRLITYEKLLIHFENGGRPCSFLHLIFLLTDRILSPSTNFERLKQGQTAPQPIFAQRRLFPYVYWPFHQLWPIPISPSNCPKSKKIPFFTDFLVRPQKKSFRLVYAQFCCHRPST